MAYGHLFYVCVLVYIVEYWQVLESVQTTVEEYVMKKGIIFFMVGVLAAISVTAFSEVYEVYTGSNDHISRYNFKIPEVTQIQTTSTNNSGIAYHQEKVYWSNTTTDIIYCSNTDGTELQELITGENNPGYLCLDAVNDKFYWKTSAIIRRANLDGTGIETVLTAGGAVVDLAVHGTMGKIFWAEGPSFGRSLKRADLDGTNIEQIALSEQYAQQINAFSVDSSHIYFASWFRPGEVFRVNHDGSNLISVMGMLPNPVFSVLVDEANNTLYWSEQAGTPYYIYRQRLDESESEGIATATEFGGFSFTKGQDALYWTQSAGVFKIDLLQKQILADVSKDIADIKTIFSPGEYAGSVYWSELDGFTDFPALVAGSGAIYRIDSDGSNQETIHSGLNSVLGIEVDADRGYLYWADVLGGTIQRSGLDGSAPETLVSDAGIVATLALDTTRNIIYWNTLVQGEIRSYDITSQVMTTIATDAYDEFGLAVDSIANKIYYQRNDIWRMNPDGTGKEVFYSTKPDCFTLDADGGTLYMMDNSLRLLDINNPTEMTYISQISGERLALRTLPPQSLTIIGSRYAALGAHVVLRVGGLPALVDTVAYEWYRDGALIPGAVTDTYEIAAAGYEHSGTYHVMVTDESKGIFMSSPFVLIVTDSPLPAANLIVLGILTVILTGLGAKSIRKRN